MSCSLINHEEKYCANKSFFYHHKYAKKRD